MMTNNVQVEDLPLLLSSKPHPVQRWIKRYFPTRMQGVILVASSAFTFSILSTLIKYASYSMSSMETVFWRSFVAWGLNYITVRTYRVDLTVKRQFWPALMTRCIIGTCGMSLGFYAMQQMVLADATVLLFTSPVLTFFLGALVLGEKIDRINLGFALFSFVGVICVSRPTAVFGKSSTDQDTPAPTIAILAAMGGATGQAVVYVSMRRLKQLHYMVVINYFLLTATVGSIFYIALVEKRFVLFTLTLSAWLALIGAGIFGFLGQLCLTRGFQLENAGTASVMRYLDVFFVFIWDLFLLHEHISEWSVIGACIICFCAIAIAIRRARHHH